VEAVRARASTAGEVGDNFAADRAVMDVTALDSMILGDLWP